MRRPHIDYESKAVGLDRNELGMFLVQAGLAGGRDHALAWLLALNGLRISEALNADTPLPPRTARAIEQCVGERDEGPLFLNYDAARRLDRRAATPDRDLSVPGIEHELMVTLDTEGSWAVNCFVLNGEFEVITRLRCSRSPHPDPESLTPRLGALDRASR